MILGNNCLFRYIVSLLDFWTLGILQGNSITEDSWHDDLEHLDVVTVPDLSVTNARWLVNAGRIGVLTA